MLTEDGKHLYVNHELFHQLIEKLALMVHRSGWKFDTILCLARGGVRPGDILSRIFDVPLAIMSTSSYRDGHGTKARLRAVCCWWTIWPIPEKHCRR